MPIPKGLNVSASFIMFPIGALVDANFFVTARTGASGEDENGHLCFLVGYCLPQSSEGAFI